jgi:hypothetical protein
MKITITFLLSALVLFTSYGQGKQSFELVLDIDDADYARSDPYNFVPYRSSIVFVTTLNREKCIYEFNDGDFYKVHRLLNRSHKDIKHVTSSTNLVCYQATADESESHPQMFIHSLDRNKQVTDFTNSLAKPANFCIIDDDPLQIAFTAWTQEEGRELYLCTKEENEYSYELWKNLPGKENYITKQLNPNELQLINGVFHFVGHPENSQESYAIYKKKGDGWETFCEMKSITDLTYFDGRYFFRGKRDADSKYLMYSYDLSQNQLRTIRGQSGMVYTYYQSSKAKRYSLKSTFIHNNELYFQIGAGGENGSRNLVKIAPGAYMCQNEDYTRDDNGFWSFVSYNNELYYVAGRHSELYRYNGLTCTKVSDEIEDTDAIKFITSMYVYKNAIYMGAYQGTNIGTELCKYEIEAVSTNSQRLKSAMTKFNIFPSPASMYFQCKMPISGTLQIYNMAGSLMTTEKLDANELGIYSTYKYSNGVYLAKFTDQGGNVFTTKFHVAK